MIDLRKEIKTTTQGGTMRQTVVHIPSFSGEYKTGLVFAMVEGLNSGESMKLICDQNPGELEVALQSAGLPELTWKTTAESEGRWVLNIQKIRQESVGCCGMCGINKDTAKGG